ncbi:MAG: hypothetical protein EXS59_02610 [Candidatus Taylorbacteria bacterium]|nr:hypothetical protein [Candidatus Taylorbacteria bacterium]
MSTELFVLGRKERHFKIQAGIISAPDTNGVKDSPPDNEKPSGKETKLKPKFVHQHTPRVSARPKFVARR